MSTLVNTRTTAMMCLLPLVLILLCFPAYAEGNPKEVLQSVLKIRAVVPESARSAATLGTNREGHGVLIDSEGLILTTGYLIMDSESIEVTGPDGQTIQAGFVGYDYTSGFGLLRARSPIPVAPMKLGRSSEVKEGDPVIVAGSGGADSAIGTLVVARREYAGSWEYLLEDAIYTSPPYASFGGAALIGADGSLLGIGSLLIQVQFPGVGIVLTNVFIPIDLLTPILNDMVEKGRPRTPSRPWLGINAEEIRGRVFVTRVTAGGPSERAGLQASDIVLKVNGAAVEGLSDFWRKVWSTGSAGVEITMNILKGAEIQEVKVRSADRYDQATVKPAGTI
jgi:S1-C subfamily serine protease